MTQIPGTNTSAHFITFTGPYPPLFYTSGQAGPVMGSVNAGNQALYVDGGGINAGFKRALDRAGQTTVPVYQNRHAALLHKTAAGATGDETYGDTDPIRFSSLTNTPVANDNLTGLTFVDVFGSHLLPHQNASNAAMVYTTPPDGRRYLRRDAFLADIETTATKLIRSVAAYNSAADANAVPVLLAIRMCLYSSGIFNAHYDNDGALIAVPNERDEYIGADGTPKPRVALDVIALRIYDGLVTGLSGADSGITEIQFPCSTNKHDPLFNAVRVKLTG